MENKEIRRGSGRTGLGILLLVVGAGWIVQRLGMPLPFWLLSWKTLLIVIGVFIGIQRNFRGVSWLIMILIGSLFLTNDLYPVLELEKFGWPIILIVIGIWFILNPKSFRKESWQRDDQSDQYHPDTSSSQDDFLDSVSVFGGVRKVILSKDFKGGEITSFLGGTELDLSKADINGRVVLEVTQVMGGTKLILPPHWDMKSELVSVFGGIEDKRTIQVAGIDPDKVLVLKGTSVFGGIDIRSY